MKNVFLISASVFFLFACSDKKEDKKKKDKDEETSISIVCQCAQAEEDGDEREWDKLKCDAEEDKLGREAWEKELDKCASRNRNERSGNDDDWGDEDWGDEDWGDEDWGDEDWGDEDWGDDADWSVPDSTSFTACDCAELMVALVYLADGDAELAGNPQWMMSQLSPEEFLFLASCGNRANEDPYFEREVEDCMEYYLD